MKFYFWRIKIKNKKISDIFCRKIQTNFLIISVVNALCVSWLKNQNQIFEIEFPMKYPKPLSLNTGDSIFTVLDFI